MSAPAGGDAPWGALFQFPFRIFFLGTALLALLVVPAWLGMLLLGWNPPLALPAAAWHPHEMLFGLLDAAIAGFLLTAVCAWTGTDRLHGAPLAVLWLLWLCGRPALAFGASLPTMLVLAVDLAFLPLVMLDAGRRIWRARQHRQLVLMLVLGLLWLMHLAFHLAPGVHAAHGALVMAMALMLVIGGRITPAFSANWLRLRGDPGLMDTRPWLEGLTIGSMLALLPLVSFGAAPALLAPVALLAALASGARLVLWRGWRVRAEPLLWILHVALAWIPLALLLLAAAALGAVPPTAWVHAAGSGAMAALILGVMSRVVLGHTGRPMRLPPGMRWAFVAILAAGALRVLTALQWLPWRAGLELAALLWLLAFGLFLWRYAGLLRAPRVDGKPG